MNPVIFNLGNIEIRWYSVLILVGVLIGLLLAFLEGKRKGIDKDTIFDLAFYTVLFGILGARIYYCIFNYQIYKNDLLEIFKVWNGGLAIHGGIIAGIITIIIFAKIKKIKPLLLTDIVAPSLILAQAIGRWGNFFNSEAHGPATSFAFLESLNIIPKFIIKGMRIDGIYYHPTFYYESLWCLLGFIILISIRWFIKNLKTGQLTCIYLIWYSVGRFFIESLRTDSLMISKYKMAQIVSVLTIIIAIILFIIITIKKEEKPELDKPKKDNKKKKKKKKKKAKKVEAENEKTTEQEEDKS